MQAVVQLNAPPNTPIFTLQARDPDTDHSIHYFIVRDRSAYIRHCLTGTIETSAGKPLKIKIKCHILFNDIHNQ